MPNRSVRTRTAAIAVALGLMACGTDSTSTSEGDTVTPPSSPPPPRVLAATQLREVRLGDAPVTVNVPVSPGAAERIRALVGAGEPERLWLVVEGVKALRPGAYYQIYLNLPAERQPDPQGPHLVGNISLYGAARGGENDQTFDITAKARDLRARGLWPGEARVTFVQGNPEPQAASPEAFLSFRRILIEER